MTEIVLQIRIHEVDGVVRPYDDLEVERVEGDVLSFGVGILYPFRDDDLRAALGQNECAP
jgi:hypothetical protein